MDSGQVVVVTSSAATAAAAASAGGDHCGEHETSAADSEEEQQQLKDGSTSEQTLVNVEPCEELRKFSDDSIQDDNSIPIDIAPVGFGDVCAGLGQQQTVHLLLSVCLVFVYHLQLN